MNLYRLISLICLSVAASSVADAQIRMIPMEKVEETANPRHSSDSADMLFETRTIVAEPMNEDDVPATFVYRFRNVGDAELKIERIVTSCSCVTAVCNTEVIKPGDMAEIRVVYDPKGHPGRFERRVYVYTQPGTAPSALLKLSVDVSQGADLSGAWPIQMGGIRLRTSEVTFARGLRAVERISFINLTGRHLALGCEDMFLPEYISFRTEPETVPEGEEGEIVMTYEPSFREDEKDVKVILKGLSLPPSRSSIRVKFIE